MKFGNPFFINFNMVEALLSFCVLVAHGLCATAVDEEAAFEGKFVWFMNMSACVVVEAFREDFRPSFGFHLRRLNAGYVQSHVENKDVKNGGVRCGLVLL